MKEFNLKKIVVVVLLIIAVVLAFMLYRQKVGTQGNTAKSISSAFVPEPGKEEEYLFSIRNDSSEEEKGKHFQYAMSIAQEAEYLDISDCNIKPLVLKVKNGEDVKLKNDSDINVNVTLDTEHSYDIGAKSTKIIKAGFGKGAGLYGYGCHSSKNSQGMMFVTP